MKINVLIADDEKQFTDTLAQRLEMRGFTVTKVYSGDAAVEMATTVAFDVIILDVQMPGLTGIDVLRQVKTKNPIVPVIMLTGEATVDNAIQGMKLGAFDFLIKPTDTESLAEKIQQAFKLKSEHEEKIRQAEIENILRTRGW